MHSDWEALFAREEEKPYFRSLKEFLIGEYGSKIVYPRIGDVFRAFLLTPLSAVKLVILGQDPYHEEGEAMGLSFSVREGTNEPPSLANIRKELEAEGLLGKTWSTDLSRWAEQGVLLLNSTLTVRAHEAGSHQGRGWEEFTDSCISLCSDEPSPKVFILWGSYARSKKPLIDSARHLVLEAPHPSPLSAYRGFIGCGHFKRANEFLSSRGCGEIDWS